MCVFLNIVQWTCHFIHDFKNRNPLKRPPLNILKVLASLRVYKFKKIFKNLKKKKKNEKKSNRLGKYRNINPIESRRSLYLLNRPNPI